MVRSNSPSDRSTSKAFKQDCRHMGWQQVSSGQEGGAPGKASCPEVSKDQPAACTGLGGQQLAWQSGQNEAKALLQR